MEQKEFVLLSPREAAAILRVSRDTLAIWRCKKRYPLPYIKVGRHVFYKSTDIDDFIEKRTVNN